MSFLISIFGDPKFIIRAWLWIEALRYPKTWAVCSAASDFASLQFNNQAVLNDSSCRGVFVADFCWYRPALYQFFERTIA